MAGDQSEYKKKPPCFRNIPLVFPLPYFIVINEIVLTIKEIPAPANTIKRALRCLAVHLKTFDKNPLFVYPRQYKIKNCDDHNE